MQISRTIIPAIIVLGIAGATVAAEAEAWPSADLAASTSLALISQPETSATEKPATAVMDTTAAPEAAAKLYASKGWSGWTVTLGAATDFESDSHYNIAGMASTFLADRLVLGAELGGWYFIQENDTGGVSAIIDLKWHFYATDDRQWTIFGEARIGMLGAFDDVPDGGTSFNFMPGFGIGATYALGESRARLIGGVRWQHVSNARISGDSDNPAFNGLLGFVGITWPF